MATRLDSGLFRDLADRAIELQSPNRQEAMAVLGVSDSETLSVVAEVARVRRHFFQDRVKLNFLLNIKSGLCPRTAITARSRSSRRRPFRATPCFPRLRLCKQRRSPWAPEPSASAWSPAAGDRADPSYGVSLPPCEQSRRRTQRLRSVPAWAYFQTARESSSRRQGSLLTTTISTQARTITAESAPHTTSRTAKKQCEGPKHPVYRPARERSLGWGRPTKTSWTSVSPCANWNRTRCQSTF